jgi:cytosine/adenosine deaminase-related metal-dependent hydrolase
LNQPSIQQRLGPFDDRPPFDMMRAAMVVQRELAADDSALTVESVLAMATNGAASLGQPERLGRIAPGQFADIVLVDGTTITTIDEPQAIAVADAQARASHGSR